MSIGEAQRDDPYLGSVLAERYRILKKIGQGGMGAVYLAEHVVIEKKVAIKILSGDLARKGELVTRFMQEAKAASRIGHENIVDITDFGQTDAGSVFFAMELLDGGDLASVIRDHGPMSWSRVRPIANQICRALGAAHGKGIVHRDLKPENIFLIERDGRSDFVKVLDFGIAKISSMDGAGERLTQTGMIFGTPEYMSPEQARGDRPDHRVDVYALGCILYEMLTGDVPFHAETFMGVLTKHMFEPPEPPSRRAPLAGISPQIEEVVLRALAKNRDERYASMRDFSSALAVADGADAALAWGQEGSGRFRDPSVPIAVGAVTSPTGPRLTERTGRARARSGLWLGILGGTAIAAAIVLWPRGPASEPMHPERAPDRPAAAPAPELAPPPSLAPAPPSEEHALTIETTPTGAEVFLGAERLGTTNGVFRFPHSATPITLRITRKGFKDHLLEVRPDHNGRYKPTLEPIGRRTGSSAKTAPARPEATSSPAAGQHPVVEIRDPFAK